MAPSLGLLFATGERRGGATALLSLSGALPKGLCGSVVVVFVCFRGAGNGSSSIASGIAACGRFRFLESVASGDSTSCAFPAFMRLDSSDRFSMGYLGDGSDVDLGNDGFAGFVAVSAGSERLDCVVNDSEVRRGIASRMKRLREGLPYVTTFREAGTAELLREDMVSLVQ